MHGERHGRPQQAAGAAATPDGQSLRRHVHEKGLVAPKVQPQVCAPQLGTVHPRPEQRQHLLPAPPAGSSCRPSCTRGCEATAAAAPPARSAPRSIRPTVTGRACRPGRRKTAPSPTPPSCTAGPGATRWRPVTRGGGSAGDHPVSQSVSSLQPSPTSVRSTQARTSHDDLQHIGHASG